MINFNEVEAKWQKKWAEDGLYKYDPNSKKEKYYCLEMFSYPSGAKLHLGHWYNYGVTDTFARFKRMTGYNLFHPMGFDAFGLPAENYAIKTGVHPSISTNQNIETMEGQLQRIGATWDWDYEVKTCNPDYYKWTQWTFLQLYKKGLAYKKDAPVNFCPKCQTVLANEQVIGGECERCGSTYSGTGNSTKICPDCHIELKETSISAEDWRVQSAEGKSVIKRQFAEGKYIIN